MLRRPGLVAAVLIGIAVLRIASTFTTFSFTTDEPIHVGAGLELLQQHEYKVQIENPPLPRIVIAAIPTLAGLRWPAAGSFYQKADEVFFESGNYRTKLVLSRTGNLLFFILGAIALFVWTRKQLGDGGALIALLLFTTQPIVLGYSGIANHDAAAVASVAVALLALSGWMERPDAKRAALLGAAYGFSALTKFSCIAYVPAACAAIWIVRWISRRRRNSAGEGGAAPLNFTILIVPVAACAIVALGYGFHIGLFLDGIRGIARFEKEGLISYAFGRTSTKGWRWYFPAAVALKTTLPFLILFVAGGYAAWRSRYRAIYAETTAATLAILAVAMPSSLDLGVRYVLPLYVPMSVATAVAVLALIEQTRWIRAAATLLVVLHVVLSLAAHPDYFPYFNILAGREPGACLIDSNLDWGQDNLRLSAAARRLRIDRIGLAIPGNRVTNTEFDAVGIPRSYGLGPFFPRAGWIALGEHFYRIQRDGWRWLDAFPMRRVGTSIRLYHVPSNVGIGEYSFDVEQLLLPLAGTPANQPGIWRVDQTITNRGSKAVHLTRTNCGPASACELAVDPGETVRIAGSDPIRPFIYVSVPKNAIDSLAFSTVARRVDRQVAGSDVVVPAVRDSEFRAGGVNIAAVPFSRNARLNLRVYVEERGMSEEARVEVRDGGRVVGRTTVPIYMTGYFTHGDFSTLFPDLRTREKELDVRIVTRARAWAFITATDADGRSAVLVPK